MLETIFRGLFDTDLTSVISVTDFLLCLGCALALGLLAYVALFTVDYRRTEYVQFEDDEYYYYVKAVPKVGVSVPEKQVKHITEDTGNRNKNTEDILLTKSLSKELGIDKEKVE